MARRPLLESTPDESDERQPVGFIGGGAAMSIDQFMNAGLALEVGLKITNTQLWAHVLASKGSLFDPLAPMATIGGPRSVLKDAAVLRTAFALSSARILVTSGRTGEARAGSITTAP
jgi:hypothetical protein